MSGRLSNTTFLVDIMEIDAQVDFSKAMAVTTAVPEAILKQTQRIAFICSITYESDAFFAEAAMVKHGLDRKFFLDEMSAVAWLHD
jgi:hypothetical protein